MVGYSGTGYKGMQITPTEKTIEGDLFTAFVKAGAISKANADDPKKASLVRCARTDKGVHAAGNMISLKLIIEDEDIVEKINAQLSPQIRIWGIERTTGSFSCYQACDSRWYEYLIPSHAFLPPHPSSWLAKQLGKFADEAGDREGYEARQEEVKSFWEEIDNEHIKPILDSLDDDIRTEVLKALKGEDGAEDAADGLVMQDVEQAADIDQPSKVGATAATEHKDDKDEKTEPAAIVINHIATDQRLSPAQRIAENEKRTLNDMSDSEQRARDEPYSGDGTQTAEPDEEIPEQMIDSAVTLPTSGNKRSEVSQNQIDRSTRLHAATKRLRKAYNTAKSRYRIPKKRVERVQEALNRFLGTRNYHNYTVKKAFRDPSAKRNIKSFRANPEPILIGNGPDEEKSEWLSLKVHGQSFMMHQIRKMVGMVSLVVRNGCPMERMNDSFTAEQISIPKVPSLGLLLERPVFNTYNNTVAPKHEREPLDFGKYEKEMLDFKNRDIYQRIFREAEDTDAFQTFFTQIDNFKEPYFLWASSIGVDATKMGAGKAIAVKEESEDEGGINADDG